MVKFLNSEDIYSVRLSPGKFGCSFKENLKLSFNTEKLIPFVFGGANMRNKVQ